VDGVRLPHKVRTGLPQSGREMISEIVSCQHNVKVPADRFDPPAELKQ
jgi:hypothetical protein